MSSNSTISCDMDNQYQDSRLRKYRPEIDGLRAFAVLGVIINHFNNDSLPGGFLGVDIFFVISGYVITSSLYYRSAPQNSFQFLASFFQRRIKRLVPALAFYVLVLSLLICAFNPVPGVSLDVGEKALLGLSNVNLYRRSFDYFSSSSDLNPFVHTWSLGVEEQFYLLFPVVALFVGFCHKSKNSNLRMAVFFLSISILSIIGFCIFYPEYHSLVYFLMPFRMWEMGFGIIAFLATIKLSRLPKNTEKYIPTIAFAVINIVFIFFW